MHTSILVLAVLFISSHGVVAQTTHPKPQSQIETKDLNQSQRAESSSATSRIATARGFYAHGLEFLEAGRLSEAAASFRNALQLDPEYADAYAALGRTYFKLREWQKAVDNLNRAAALKTRQRYANEIALQRSAAEKQKQADPSRSTEAANNSPKTAPALNQTKAPESASSHPNESANTTSKQIKPVQSNNAAAATPTTSKPADRESSTQTAPEIASAKQNIPPKVDSTNSPPQASASPKEIKSAVTPPKNALTEPRVEKAPQVDAPKETPQRIPDATPASSKDANLPVSEQTAIASRVSEPVTPVPVIKETVTREVAPVTPTEETSLTKVYRVGPNDVLDVRLNEAPVQHPTLYAVTPAGLLEHPLLNEPMLVTGLTVEEIGSRIEDDLRRRAIVESPKALVGVKDYASHTVLVSGLVKDSGTKVLRREAIPLYVVVADAQPLPEAAKVTVIRGDQNQIHEIDLSEAADLDFLVRSGDVITLQPHATEFIYIGGEIKFPGEKKFRRGLTLMQVILASGGIGPKAKTAEVARNNEKGFLIPTRFKLKELVAGKAVDPLLKPGDRISILR